MAGGNARTGKLHQLDWHLAVANAVCLVLLCRLLRLALELLDAAQTRNPSPQNELLAAALQGNLKAIKEFHDKGAGMSQIRF